MFSPDQYELIDFGDGRKLERFGDYVLDRLSPSAEGKAKRNPDIWKTADTRYERTGPETGRWRKAKAIPKCWHIEHGPVTFEIKPTSFGHVGIFPEQAVHWDWIAKQVQRADRPLSVLNLFAYTGGSTLAAAAAGAQVTHVDSAKAAVVWARRNAEISGLAEAPIRWIVEDATRFVRREIRRGRTYDAIILDPPSYGHGPKREVWKLATHLMPLLKGCGKLTQSQGVFFLLTCHTPGYGAPELEASLASITQGACQAGVRATALALQTARGRKLQSGYAARWSNRP